MGLTFEQKNQIIDFLATAQNWTNIFNDAFFADEKRKWHSLKHGDVTLSSSPDSLQAYAIHEPSGTSLHIDRRDKNIIRITDERHQSLTYQNGKFSTRDDTHPDISLILSSAEFGFNQEGVSTLMLSPLKVILRFDKKGSKTVFFDDLGHKVSYPAPKEAIKRELQGGRFFQCISFSNAQAKEWDLHPLAMLHNAKLIVAKDMDVEPHLRAINELDGEKAQAMLMEFLRTEYDKDWKGPEAWRPKIKKELGDLTAAEKKWLDTTDFTGNIIDLPQRFFISTTDDGFNLTTSSDTKHAIWTHGDVLQQVKDTSITPVQTVSLKTTMQSLLHIIGRGETMYDHLNREWNVIVLQSPNTKEIIKSTKDCMRGSMGLTNHDYAALNFGENRCLLAMESQTLERITLACHASHTMLALISAKSTDANAVRELLKDGADYKYINLEETQRGKTFADLMKENGTHALLDALQEEQGLHDLNEPDDTPSLT